MLVKLWIGIGACENHLPDAMLANQGDECIQIVWGKLAQVIATKSRIKLVPDAKITTRVTRSREQQIGEVIHGFGDVILETQISLMNE